MTLMKKVVFASLGGSVRPRTRPNSYPNGCERTSPIVHKGFFGQRSTAVLIFDNPQTHHEKAQDNHLFATL
ncbi:hypothetical protein VTN96DRAFT_5217 [Rasamsonia emersonii]